MLKYKIISGETFRNGHSLSGRIGPWTPCSNAELTQRIKNQDVQFEAARKMHELEVEQLIGVIRSTEGPVPQDASPAAEDVIAELQIEVARLTHTKAGRKTAAAMVEMHMEIEALKSKVIGLGGDLRDV